MSTDISPIQTTQLEKSFDEENLNKLNQLKNAVEENKTAYAIAKANDTSMQAKAKMFQGLAEKANTTENYTYTYDQEGRTASQSAGAVFNSATKSQNLSVTIFNLVKDMAAAVNIATVATIEAAKEVSILNDLILRKKAKNPVLRDEVVTSSDGTVKDAAAAVTAMVLALESSYTALKNSETFSGSCDVTKTEAGDLVARIDGTGKNVSTKNPSSTSLLGMLEGLYNDAFDNNILAQKASLDATREAQTATAEFKRADAELASSEAAYAAAKATLGVK